MGPKEREIKRRLRVLEHAEKIGNVQDIFGNQYTVIDNIERLPEKLPQLFMALTK